MGFKINFWFACFIIGSLKVDHKKLDKLYLPSTSTRITIHLCPNLCLAFMGEYKNDLICRICSTERFHRCSRTQCKDLSYNQCTCSLNLRIPNVHFEYKPLIPQIKRLVESKQFQHYYSYTKERFTLNDNTFQVAILCLVDF